LSGRFTRPAAICARQLSIEPAWHLEARSGVEPDWTDLQPLAA
jgi:hypothetical protein